MEEVKLGHKLFVPDKQKSRFGDTVIGGVATVALIKKMSNDTFVTMKETGDIQWNLDNLLMNQKEYEKLYTDKVASFYSDSFERDGKLW
jgi:hypothetical protein